MWNLIRKDMIIQKVQILFFIPFILVISVFANLFHPVVIFLLAGAYIPINGIHFDAMVNSNILLNSLPYTRKEIVSAKYIGAVVYMVVFIAFAGVTLFIANYDFSIHDITVALSLSLILIAVVFPLFYLLNPALIGSLILISLAVMAAILPSVFNYVASNFTAITEFFTGLSKGTMYLGGVVIVIGLYMLSWLVSQHIYRQKVF